MTTLRSPQTLVDAASEQLLGGREAKTKCEWVMVMSFVAAHLAPETAHDAARLIGAIYRTDIDDETMDAIVDYQQEQRREADRKADLKLERAARRRFSR